MLLDQEFLEGILPPFTNLVAVNAMFDNGELVEIVGHHSMDGKKHYLFDTSFTTMYKLVIAPMVVVDSLGSTSTVPQLQASSNDAYNGEDTTIKSSYVEVSSSLSLGGTFPEDDMQSDRGVSNESTGNDCLASESIINVIQFKEKPCVLKSLIERIRDVV